MKTFGAELVGRVERRRRGSRPWVGSVTSFRATPQPHKNKMETLLKTSRTQVDRLLDPKNDITLGSLQRAAAIVGRRVNVELV